MTRASDFLRASITACAALACLAMLPTAQADTRPDKKKMVASLRVNYADLDLARPMDAQVLFARIKQAAFRACGGDPREHRNYDMMPNRVEAAFQECREDAVVRAVATLPTSVAFNTVELSDSF